MVEISSKKKKRINACSEVSANEQEAEDAGGTHMTSLTQVRGTAVKDDWL